MADEIRVRSMIQIDKDGLKYVNKGSDFLKDMATAKGPSPGSFTPDVTGTIIDLSQLASYGGCIFKNYDATNKVEFGFFINNVFYPLAEIGPGEEWAYYLSENLGEQYGTAGTGTTGAALDDYLMARSIDAVCNISVEIFER